MRPARRRLLRPGVYLDSVVLLDLQRRLAAEPGVLRAAAVMATPANQELLAVTGLVGEAAEADADDLLVVIDAADEAAADAAMARVDALLAARAPAGGAAPRPRSLEVALRQLPAARWVLVSVPGAWAGGVARQALDAGRHVFLFSDHVPLAEEVALKRTARQRGLLLLGPDCGTAIVGGTGLGFANRVRRGDVGVVAASGTGLQAFCAHLDALGGGVSHALGTGGRDLQAEVGGLAAQQALATLGADPSTRVLVLISKPPAPAVAGRLLALARRSGKPLVAWLLGVPAPARRVGDVWFAASAADAAETAARLAAERAAATHDGARPPATDGAAGEAPPALPAAPPGVVRALCAGGTIATQLVAGLQLVCPDLESNVPLRPEQRLADLTRLRGHAVLDMGADELTAGRPHPMLDPRPLADRLLAEAEDAAVGMLIVDVMLGDGVAADPAGVLASAIAAARERAVAGGRELTVVALVQGTAADPQGLDAQCARLADAGATVCTRLEDVLATAWEHVGRAVVEEPAAAVTPDALEGPLAAVNVGLEIFHESLRAQGAQSVAVDWRPPAGGDADLAALLRRMR